MGGLEVTRSLSRKSFLQSHLVKLSLTKTSSPLLPSSLVSVSPALRGQSPLTRVRSSGPPDPDVCASNMQVHASLILPQELRSDISVEE